jgi:hypothetical protein
MTTQKPQMLLGEADGNRLCYLLYKVRANAACPFWSESRR